MSLVSDIMHRRGFRMRRYLDDWLVQASSVDKVLQARDFLLNLCQELGIRINVDKSSLIPAQKDVFGDDNSDASFEGFPDRGAGSGDSMLTGGIPVGQSSTCEPVEKLAGLNGLPLTSSSRVLSPDAFSAGVSQESLGLSGRECIHSLGRFLPEGSSVVVKRTSSDHRRKIGLPYSRCSSVHRCLRLGLGCNRGGISGSGPLEDLDQEESINYRQLRAVEEALSCFAEQVNNKTIALFYDNVTAVSYLKKEGETRSQALNGIAQRVLRWCEDHRVSLIPQFVSGKLNVLADALSCSQEVLGGEWTLVQEEVQLLLKRWPATIDLFATRLNFRLPVYFSSVAGPMSCGTDAMLHY
ncbi:uncharacterized protein [Macrobrachium rosenbergii]|uniref:uncharacterized protein n=1 Tax=Macrobrachium rosenbergii TaxID=79674 RepID=UPI0034D563AA